MMLALLEAISLLFQEALPMVLRSATFDSPATSVALHRLVPTVLVRMTVIWPLLSNCSAAASIATMGLTAL
jgi:hypothetical protein